MENKKKISLIEGLLFINGDEGVSLEEVSIFLDISIDESEELIVLIQNKYKKDLECGLELQRFAKNKFRMITKKENSEYYIKLANLKTESRLSSASIEVLSIIAYKGPVTKADVENIRGVNCDNIFYKLKLRNLISEVGKSNDVGKPTLYNVTTEFLKYFNLNSLEELPKLKESNISDKEIFNRG
ncbi:SMC-Scp complex subunit ScpB [Spiroplasma turonicum]|uniref:Chromosome condensation and segregation factor B n=1 Tax=Spiroplasma turonicum TaxID=216946 RepID=A0A0K1P7G1_9MOLU|nr:SMC-Scp complex subunit ScpB [Spiroplasma turonicum]AKU80119.1 chromosome condensation and segregation factor B [Spiroplasma turonicum]ALX71119.1 chromosome condensation and segregation factor B [Spiroplasma turonicum]